jgi:hypothetical protein
MAFTSEASMVRLKSVGVMSVAKIAALMYGGLALILVPLFLLVAVVMSFFPQGTPDQPSAITFVAFAVVSPFLYAGMGFIVGAITGFAYNIVARWVGGLELHFDGALAPQPIISSLPPTT